MFRSGNRACIFSLYSFLSITTKQLPLSAFITTRVLSFFKPSSALRSAAVVFLCLGGLERRRMFAAEVRMASLDSSGKSLIAASISATMFLWGIRDGVRANLGPFSRIARSSVDKGLLERLMTHLLKSVEFPGLNSCLKFCNFFWCLVVMWFFTDLALFFKNCEKRARSLRKLKLIVHVGCRL